METTRVFAASALLLMFLLSGAQKVRKLGNTQTKQLTSVFGLPQTMAQGFVLAAGILEVVTVMLIMRYEMYETQKGTARASVAILAAFTVLVTLAYKVYPTFKMIQALANLSVFGGLVLYYKCLS